MFGGSSTCQPRKAEDCKEEVLKEGSEARKYAVSLKGLAYGDQLVDQLFSHSAHMEKLYEKATELLSSSSPKDPKLQKLINVYKEKSAWFGGVPASSRSMNIEWCLQKKGPQNLSK